MDVQHPNFLGPYDFSALEAFFAEKPGRRDGGMLTLRVVDIREQLRNRGSVMAKQAVQNLLRVGCIAEVPESGPLKHYIVTPAGERFYQRFVKASLDEISGTDSAKWTGIIAPAEVRYVLKIVQDIEDVALSISSNEKRSQIIGLVTALRAILETPEPPRQPILSIVRDPAFAHILEVGSFLLLIGTFLKT